MKCNKNLDGQGACLAIGIDDTTYIDGINKMANSTRFAASDTPPGMGRHRINGEQTMARFRDGTLERIKAVLRGGEKQADFIRGAVEREIARREAAAPEA